MSQNSVIILETFDSNNLAGLNFESTLFSDLDRNGFKLKSDST